MLTVMGIPLFDQIWSSASGRESRLVTLKMKLIFWVRIKMREAVSSVSSLSVCASVSSDQHSCCPCGLFATSSDFWYILPLSDISRAIWYQITSIILTQAIRFWGTWDTQHVSLETDSLIHWQWQRLRQVHLRLLNKLLLVSKCIIFSKCWNNWSRIEL